jgi:Zn-dependent M28 family amino/carboxypeptidase
MGDNVTTRCVLRAAGGLAAAVLVSTTALATPAQAAPRHDPVRRVTTDVRLDRVLGHLTALQRIADRNGGNRASGLPGYKASVDYVVRELRMAGYRPQVQEFTFTYTEEFSELERLDQQPRTFDEGTDFLRNAFTPTVFEGEATGPLVPVDLVIPPTGTGNVSTSGCEAADFAGFPAGGVALMQRGTCGFAVKALNAQAAGAVGAVIMNEGQPGRTGLISMIGDAPGLSIPVLGATFAAGEELARTPGARVRVKVDFFAEERPTWNVIAETRRGNDANVVMAGAHLDSVPEGPGINDNGSGSAALIEVAKAIAKRRTTNTVRFAWWGAEESGLLGSEHYVDTLTAQQREDIALYLNFDMIASPNYTFGVYDGDNSGGTAAPGFIPEGSAAIEDVFEKFFADRGLASQDSEFSGRSDYGPFIAVGIPAGGLFTGAEGVKTAAEVARYGGIAGVAYDPCYHAACDNLTGEGQPAQPYDALRDAYRLVGNVNLFALDVNSDAIATAVATFAKDTSTVNPPAPAARPAASPARGADGGHAAHGEEAAR